ncbi:dihydroorotate dehydrogenase [Synergistales bacterium]|nr:dihydroorotate dehydrogenase [Synergistales bacterium]
MLRSWGTYPLLSRPISVFDADGDSVSFLYRAVGEGTDLLSKLREGGDISVGRPLGSGFPNIGGRVAMVGGGAGIAPLYLAAKTLKSSDERNTADMYLGFSGEPLLLDEYGSVCDALAFDVGGFVTDIVPCGNYDCVISCGPEAMMRALHEKCKTARVPLYVSLEKHMACGFGVCLGCSLDTTRGRKKVCADGPVFKSDEVFAKDLV